MEALTSPEAGLAGLFASAFLAATLLPGGSEFAFMAYLKAHPGLPVAALGVATLGNTLGGMTSVWLGRRLPATPEGRFSSHAAAWARKHGALALLLSWLPLVGDALCVAAGWLRLPWIPVTLWMCTGKCLRYLGLLLLVA